MVLLGVLFCGLLVAFAVTSKVAAYYPHNDAARPIAAARMWQQQGVAVRYAPPEQAAHAFLLFMLVPVSYTHLDVYKRQASTTIPLAPQRGWRWYAAA